MQPVRDTGGSVKRSFLAFAEQATHNLSETYAEWARGVAADSEVLDLLAQLERERTVPMLVFASLRAVGIPVAEWATIRRDVIRRWPAVREIIESHATQTNEAARCAVLLPLLAAIPGPLAIIEVGASAGLCLLPDRYSYRFHTAAGIRRLDPDDGPSAVVIDCDLEGTDAPTAMPDIVWRAGLDLNPLDISDPETARWLELLVWPEHNERRERLAAAAELATKHPLRIVRGDAVDAIGALAAEAPDGATVVVFHTAVLAYLTADDRDRFVDVVSTLDVRWISNEGITVTPGVRERLPREPDSDADFVVALDGDPVAFASGHGRWVRFFA